MSSTSLQWLFSLTHGVGVSSSSHSNSSSPAGFAMTETIETERIIDEQLHETHQRSRTVFNPCVAELIGMMSEIDEMKAQYREFERLKEEISHRAYENALDDGKTVGEAKQFSEEIKQAVEIVADADKKSQVKRTENVQKMRRKVAENPQLQAQTQAMSDEQFAEFVKNYTQIHEDSLAQDLINQCIISAIEEQKIHNDASNRLKSMPFSEKAKLYVDYFVEELSTQSTELLTLAIDNPQEFIRLGANTTIDVTATVADFMTPMDASAGVELARGEISGSEFMTRQGIALTAGSITNKIAKARCVAKFVSKVGNAVQNGVINRVAKGIGPYKIVGGHHPIQQAAFKDHPLYDFREVLAISRFVAKRFFARSKRQKCRAQKNRIFRFAITLLKYEYKNKYREKLIALAKKRHISAIEFFGSIIRGVCVKRLFRSVVLKRNSWSCDANVCQAFIVRCTKKFMKWP